MTEAATDATETFEATQRNELADFKKDNEFNDADDLLIK